MCRMLFHFRRVALDPVLAKSLPAPTKIAAKQPGTAGMASAVSNPRRFNPHAGEQNRSQGERPPILRGAFVFFG